jgi:hypothetical protein
VTTILQVTVCGTPTPGVGGGVTRTSAQPSGKQQNCSIHYSPTIPLSVTTDCFPPLSLREHSAHILEDIPKCKHSFIPYLCLLSSIATELPSVDGTVVPVAGDACSDLSMVWPSMRRWMPFRRGGGRWQRFALVVGAMDALMSWRRKPFRSGDGSLGIVAMEDGGDLLVDGCPFVVAAELLMSWR